MKKIDIVLKQLTIFTFLLIVLNSCKGKSQNSSTRSEEPNSNTTTQLNGINSTAKIIDKNIRSIFQDSKGNYWVGTNGAGVYRFDTKNLTQFTVENGLADNQVISIQEDPLGNLWFGTGKFGISKFDGTSFSTQTNKVIITKGKASDWESKNNDLWFYAGSGVFRYNNSLLYYLPFEPGLNSKAAAKAPFSLSRYGVYCILKDKKGHLWFGTQAEGVCRFDGKTLTWFKEKGLAGPAVLALFEDSKGNLWFGNNGAGLFLYDGISMTNFSDEKGLNNTDFRSAGKSGLGTLARIYSINEDITGNIWVGTVDAGVWKYDGNNFTNYTTKDGLTSNAVNTIYKDKYGELWFGTDGNGICKFNGSTFTEFIIQ